ncbi:hypothetical protein ACRAWD_16100 [Caulobacter segnis]
MRFAFGPGAFGSGWSTGAMTASIDTAGRRFIVVLGARTDGSAPRPPPDRRGGRKRDLPSLRNRRGCRCDGGQGARCLPHYRLGGRQPDAHGRFWRPDSSFDISAGQPPADLITRALTI